MLADIDLLTTCKPKLSPNRMLRTTSASTPHYHSGGGEGGNRKTMRTSLLCALVLVGHGGGECSEQSGHVQARNCELGRGREHESSRADVEKQLLASRACC